MNIFINGATREKSILLFDDTVILDQRIWTESGKESEHVLPGILSILEKNNVSCADLTHITVVHGPGAFTGLRVVVSVINTIQFVHTHIEVRALSVGELFSVVDNNQHNRYVFQIYPADMFMFGQEGEFLERVPEASIIEHAGENMAGEVLEDSISVDSIPVATQWEVETLQQIQKKATPTRGILIPFYAKEPNITTRKQS